MNAEDQTADNGTLLLDIGNTNLKWAWLRDGRLGEISSISHRMQNIDELATGEWSSLTTPDAIYIASVAGSALDAGLAVWIRQRWGLEPRFIRSGAEACGVINSYPRPERLGVDRWLSMIALYTRLPGQTCVVDCGTAVTIDVIDASGRHLGGLILPGFGLMRRALAEYTAIPFEGTVGSCGLLATDTESAIASGGVNAVAALVGRIGHELSDKVNGRMELVLTGGDAEILQHALEMPSRIEKDLVMQGIAALINNGTV